MRIFKKRKEERTLDNIRTNIITSNTYNNNEHNSIVIACKNMIIDSISNLPIRLYFRKNDDVRIEPFNHPLYQLFKYQPNTEEPISLFLSRLMDELIEKGNVYIYKVKDEDGNIVSLYILDGNKVKVFRNEINQKMFQYNNKTYSTDTILHIAGKYYNGLVGKSLTYLADTAIDLSNRLTEYTRYHFDNMVNGGRLKLNIDEWAQKNNLTDASDELQAFIQSLSAYLRNNFTGEENAGKSLILPYGIKAEMLESGSNQNAQLAQLRELQERYICQVFDIPYDIFTGDNKYNSLEQRNELFKNRTLQFWTTRIQDFLNFLLTPYERERYYFEFDYNQFLKTDKKTRTEVQIKQLQNGLLTINEIRKQENQTGIDSEIGDIRFIPNTYIPLTDENIQAYFAKSKLALQDIDKNNIVGDDKK